MNSNIKDTPAYKAALKILAKEKKFLTNKSLPDDQKSTHPRRRGRDALSQLTDAVYARLYEYYLVGWVTDPPTNNDVILSLTGWEPEIIQEIDWDKKEIYWIGSNQNEKTTNFKDFYDRMTATRKRFTPPLQN